MAQELAPGVVADINKGMISLSALDGKVELKVALGLILKAKLEEIEAKVQSGEIDLVKDSEMDKVALLPVLAFIKKELGL